MKKKAGAAFLASLPLRERHALQYAVYSRIEFCRNKLLESIHSPNGAYWDDELEKALEVGAHILDDEIQKTTRADADDARRQAKGN